MATMTSKRLYLLFCLIWSTFCLSLALANFSVGDHYYARLQQWYELARANRWSEADALATHLDPADIAEYQSRYHPTELKKSINSLVIKPKKTVEDWMELARIQAILGKNEDSLQSLSTAHDLDPIRDDISTLYYQTKR